MQQDGPQACAPCLSVPAPHAQHAACAPACVRAAWSTSTQACGPAGPVCSTPTQFALAPAAPAGARHARRGPSSSRWAASPRARRCGLPECAVPSSRPVASKQWRTPYSTSCWPLAAQHVHAEDPAATSGGAADPPRVPPLTLQARLKPPTGARPSLDGSMSSRAAHPPQDGGASSRASMPTAAGGSARSSPRGAEQLQGPGSARERPPRPSPRQAPPKAASGRSPRPSLHPEQQQGGGQQQDQEEQQGQGRALVTSQPGGAVVQLGAEGLQLVAQSRQKQEQPVDADIERSAASQPSAGAVVPCGPRMSWWWRAVVGCSTVLRPPRDLRSRVFCASSCPVLSSPAQGLCLLLLIPHPSLFPPSSFLLPPHNVSWTFTRYPRTLVPTRSPSHTSRHSLSWLKPTQSSFSKDPTLKHRPKGSPWACRGPAPRAAPGPCAAGGGRHPLRA